MSEKVDMSKKYTPVRVDLQHPRESSRLAPIFLSVIVMIVLKKLLFYCFLLQRNWDKTATQQGWEKPRSYCSEMRGTPKPQKMVANAAGKLRLHIKTHLKDVKALKNLVLLIVKQIKGSQLTLKLRKSIITMQKKKYPTKKVKRLRRPVFQLTTKYIYNVDIKKPGYISIHLTTFLNLNK